MTMMSRGEEDRKGQIASKGRHSTLSKLCLSRVLMTGHHSTLQIFIFKAASE